jgi:hypothetical protein
MREPSYKINIEVLHSIKTSVSKSFLDQQRNERNSLESRFLKSVEKLSSAFITLKFSQTRLQVTQCDRANYIRFNCIL